MASFHDNKLWQDVYVAALDVLDTAEIVGNSEVMIQMKNHALTILTVTADALSRKDRREMDDKIRNVNGLVAALRSLMSVAWAQELLSDDQFGKLDQTYEEIAKQVGR